MYIYMKIMFKTTAIQPPYTGKTSDKSQPTSSGFPNRTVYPNASKNIVISG